MIRGINYIHDQTNVYRDELNYNCRNLKIIKKLIRSASNSKTLAISIIYNHLSLVKIILQLTRTE